MSARLKAGDLVSLGFLGVRSRVMRSVLTALGITVGIAALVGVMGVSASSKADLMQTLDRLGTNYLQVTPGQSVLGEDATLPESSRSMIARVNGVEEAAGVGGVKGTVRRNDMVSSGHTNGISIRVVDTNLLRTMNGTMRAGAFLNDAQATLPTVVLGDSTATRLGISKAEVDAGVQVWLADKWFTVVGIMDSLPLAEDFDSAALVGWPIAKSELGFDGSPTTVYVRTQPSRVDDVRALLPATANPENAEQVRVSRPSDILEAKAAAGAAFTGLLVGLGAVALFVGGIGIANVMIIAVLERRSEIGLRRAVGATRTNIAVQFLSEAMLQASIGGICGTAVGATMTVVYAQNRGWPVAMPITVVVGGVVIAMLIGAVAGLYPATRAARLAPADALRPV